MDQYHLFVVLAPIALALALGIAVYAWFHRLQPYARILAIMMLPICGFLITNSMELLDPVVAGKVLWAKAGYFFLPFAPVLWLAFALDYTGRHKWLTLRRFWPLFIIPLIGAILTLTNELHHLIWTSTTVEVPGGLSPLSVTYGYWYWFSAAYSYVLLLTGAYLVLREYILYVRTFRWQSIWILVGMIFPLSAQIIYAFHLFPAWRKDYTPIGFAFTGLAFAIGIFRYHLFNLAPIARSLLMDYLEDGVAVLDTTNQVVDVNPALRRMVRADSADRLIGKQVSEVLPFWKGLKIPDDAANMPAAKMPQDQFEIVVDLPHGVGFLSYEMRVLKLKRPRGKSIGRLVTLHDITERKRLMAAVEQLAITDPLTGLYNRRYFSHRAQEEMERMQRLDHSLAMMMMDLDNFKVVNDTHGHSIGDEVLVGIAAILQKSMRKIDTLARYGGEEFIALLPETSQQDAVVVADRIRQQVAAQPLTTSVGEISLTISIGVTSTTRENPLPLEEMIQRSDQALYAAKHSGRNNVKGFEESVR